MKWVTIKKASELSGYSEKAIEAKRADGTWLENVIWIKAPDGRILISTEGIDEWAEGRVYAPQVPRQLRSRSSTPAADAERNSSSPPTRQTSDTPQT